MSGDKRPFENRLLSENLLKKLDEIAAPARRIPEQYKPLLDTVARMESRLKPFVEQSARITAFAGKFQTFDLLKPRSSYQGSTYHAGGKTLQTVPQPSTPPIVTSKPHPEKRPSTLDKDADRREIYAQVVREIGRYAQQGVLIEEAAKRAGCTARTMWRAIKGKK